MKFYTNFFAYIKRNGIKIIAFISEYECFKSKILNIKT